MRIVGDADGFDFPLPKGSFPREQLRQSPRLVLPGSTSRQRCFVPKASFLFFSGQNTPYSRRWASRACQVAHKAGARPGGRARPIPCGPPGRHPMPIFCYMVCFHLEKIRRKLSGRSAAVSRRNLGRSNLGLRRSCSAGENSLREGGIEAIVITNDPLIGRGSISINIFTRINQVGSRVLPP